jgi:hypothetical protein
MLNSKWSWVRSVAGAGVLCLGFLLLVYAFYNNWYELQGYNWEVNWRIVGAAAAVNLVGSFLFVGGWNRIIHILGWSFPYRDALKVNFLSNLGKYIPGKLWFFGGVVYLCKQHGIPIKISAGSIGLMTLIQIVSALLIFVTSTMLWPSSSVLSTHSFKLVIIGVLGLLSLQPHIIRFVLPRLGLDIDRSLMEDRIRYRTILGIIAYWMFIRAIDGASYFLLIRSLTDFPSVSFWVITGIISVSWVIGFLAVFVPAGLVVWEGSLVVLLSAYMPVGQAVVFSLLARILRTITDVLCFGVGFGLSMRSDVAPDAIKEKMIKSRSISLGILIGLVLGILALGKVSEAETILFHDNFNQQSNGEAPDGWSPIRGLGKKHQGDRYRSAWGGHPAIYSTPEGNDIHNEIYSPWVSLPIIKRWFQRWVPSETLIKLTERAVVIDGNYDLKGSHRELYIETLAGDPNWSDYAVAARFIFREDKEAGNFGDTYWRATRHARFHYYHAGVSGRFRGPNNYFDIDKHPPMEGYQLHFMYEGGMPGAFHLVKIVNGEHIELAETRDIQPELDRWYTIRLEMVGPSLKGYLDGELVLSATDHTFSRGKIGLSTFETWAKFDDVKVIDLRPRENPSQ